MLDAETKRRIDTCRDILVGKVPDPKSQVEQITIALIYKFMDDMDREAEDLGGQRSFFAGDFAHYGWARLKAPQLSGKDKLDLYAEAIGKMNENPGIPALFRDIFKNAYLPYRDPETLRAFLKEIDGFTYDHSERLGDAFEYLLSVLGSQGDAGQFRTPRHIIDFMVEVIDPQKHESILDPACGTAGFLISAWKHILRQNTSHRPLGEGPGVRVGVGDKLTPDERQNLAANIRGYDISPDMVRLSLVNLYLHGFTDPHIVEYDTLTSEERWNETADVILANPPFMSPKGGIKPHKRFSVQATRSEVLFVDYIAEHLSPNGRAAIVVPEGIIFQSGTAYKKLREMLVKNSLIAVVSLPAGVFNPYSGVKTSILILDRRRAKTCDSVLFVKVENDGFGLGAQRRAVTGSDLPEAKRLLDEFFSAPDGFGNQTGAHKVTRAKIGENGEWNLSGERYVETASVSSVWPTVALGEVTKRLSGGTPSMAEPSYWTGDIPWVSPKDMKVEILQDTQDHVSETAIQSSATSLVPPGTLLCVVRSGILKHSLPLALTSRSMCFNQDITALVPTDDRLDVRFLFSVLRARSQEILAKGIKPGVTVQSFHSGFFSQYKIPLPPLAIQQEIVAEIEGYQKIIDGARQVVENYRPRIDVQPDWPRVGLGSICSLGGTITTEVDLSLPYFGADSIESHTGKLLKTETALSQRVNGPVYAFSGARLLYSKIRPYLNKLTVVDLQGYCSSDMYPLILDQSKALTTYLATYMLSVAFNDSIRGYYERASIPKINRAQLFSTEVPLPKLETQRTIVAEIEAEQALVDANKQLIARFEAKIKAVIDRFWGGEKA